MPAPVFVLVDGPKYLNIPYFQMPDPTSREDQCTPLDLRNCRNWWAADVLLGLPNVAPQSGSSEPETISLSRHRFMLTGWPLRRGQSQTSSWLPSRDTTWKRG